FAVAAQLMRRILIDAIRASRAAKRGGEAPLVRLPTNWDEIPPEAQDHAEELLSIDEALTRLASMDPRCAKVVELRVFAGLGVQETAEALAISEATVKRNWKVAKAWLLRELWPGASPMPPKSTKPIV